jgi:hypothetical protein
MTGRVTLSDVAYYAGSPLLLKLKETYPNRMHHLYVRK